MTTDICGIILVAVGNRRLDVARALIDNVLCSSISPGYTTLHVACEKGHIAVVRYLLQSQEYKDTIHCCTADGITPLHVGCAEGHLEVVQCLLKSSNYPNVTSAHNITPLHLACIQNHEHIVKILLCNKECDVNIQTSNGFTPLQIVLFSNNTRLLCLLKDNSARGSVVVPYSKNRKQKSVPLNDGGDHLLHLACQWEDWNIVEYLVIAEQCDVEVVDKRGNTPLHIAALHNKPAIAKFLITSGCHPNISNNSGDTPLHIACYERSIEAIKSLLLLKTDTKVTNAKGHTPQTIPLNEDVDLLLHLACQWGYTWTDIVKYLVYDQQCDVKVVNKYGNTPLHIAACHNQHSIVRFLITSGCDQNIRNNTGNTPLHLACRWAGTEMVKYLVNDQHCDVEVANKHGNTPLHIAARYKKPAIVRFLITSGCHQNISNNSGDTPLHIACYERSTEVIKWFLLHKSNTNVTNAKGHTPQTIPLNEDGDLLLHLACQLGDTNLVEYLVNDQQCDVKVVNKYGNTPLHIAACHNQHSIVRFLITSGCDQNIRNNTGNTPLHLACRWAGTEMVKYLVNDQHCDVEVANKHGNTPLHIAARYKKPAIVRFLITSGCHQNISNNSGDTPLHIACYEQSIEAIKSLLLLKSNTKMTNAKGDTPQTIPLNEDGDLLLHLACQWGDTNIVEYLVNDQQCDVKVVNKYGNTPLHIAACHIQHSNVRFLITIGCDQNIRNISGDTPLHLACQWAGTEMVKYLVNDQHCDVEVANKHGNTPLHIAARYKKPAIVRFLITSGCHQNISNNSGDTPLHIACYEQSIEAIKSLLLLKSNTKMTNAKGDTPQTIPLNEDGDLLLHLACQWGDTNIVEYLVNDQQCDVKVVNKYGNTPLHIAACHIQHSNVRFLITIGCDQNIRNISGDTPLHLACQWAGTEMVKYLVNDQHCDVEAANKHGDTPLHIAARYKKPAIVRFLITSGCHQNISNNSGDTPLHIACYEQSINAIMSLIQFKSNTRLTNAKGHTPQTIPLNEDGDLVLHLACQWGHIEVVEYLVNDEQCDVNATNIHGSTPLHIACYAGVTEVIRVLLNKRCNTQIVNNRNDTPQTVPMNPDGDLLLHLACQWGDTAVVEYLVSDQQCDINGENFHGNTPLHIVVTHGLDEIVDALLNHEGCNPNLANHQRETPLHVSVRQRDVKITNLLIGKCNPNTTNDLGDSPLHIAANMGRVEICKVLLQDKRCDPNIQNTSQHTPLHVAVTHGLDEIVDALLNHEGCNPNLANHQQETPLHISVRQRDVKITNLLIGKCNPNTTNDLGDSPLHIAANMGRVEICKLLLEDKRCDPNIQNTSQNTPLHVAVAQGKLEIVKALAEDARCNLNIQFGNGYTPLHLAISNSKHHIARYLINDTGCDPTIPDTDGNTPLHHACKHSPGTGIITYSPEMTDVAYLLLSHASVDPNHVNNDGQTPVELTTSYELIQKINYFNECKNEHSVETYIKVFILGNPETGKSTLVKAICREATKWLRLLPPSLRRVKNVPAHTAGIIPTTFRSKKFGNTVLYDLAGQYEYYSSHAAVIETSVRSSPPAFLVVINLSESHDEIMRKVKYWWSFIDNHAARSNAPPHVILVGSHADVVKSRGEKAKEKLAQILIAIRKISSSFYYAGEVALDCRNPTSKGLNRLCSQLDQSCSVLRQSVDKDLHCHVMYAFLQTDLFRGLVACTISDIAAAIKDEDVLLPHDPTGLVRLISSLSDKGLVLLVEAKNMEESWVVLQKQTLLSEINGTIFAPQTFRQHQHFSRSTGVVPFSKLVRAFPEHDQDMITGFLTHLEFCFKIDDMETLRRIEDEARSVGGTSTDLDPLDQYYFFPALVSVENPLQVWQPDDSMTYQCGWYYKCTHPDQFLTTRFLQVLILRLAFTFALAIDPHHCPQDDVPVLCRRCSVWKHGIGWLDRDGIETVVEVGLQCRWVSVMMRCPKRAEIMCCLLRSMIIRNVVNAKSELSSAVKMSESILHPSQVQYPFQVEEQHLKLYTLSEIANAIAAKKPCVVDQHGQDALPITELLSFEPYFGIGRDLLMELFSQNNQSERVPECFLAQMASLAYPQIDQYTEAIDPQPVTSFQEDIRTEPTPSRQCLVLFRALHRRINPTYENFHKELDQFSIFCGRNPMDFVLSPALETQDPPTVNN